ncbi:MAG TPA: flagellar hook protein FlgE, partial [Deltaproteobacteria bacterium]|nr:flagellar hook protein FlgE [Deltaproteobacteria bacterium]
AMGVIGDNIANVNTIGFKSSRTTFEDVLSQSISTASGSSQIGRGATMSDVDTLFQQGSFESTSNATDLAISDNGFFIVSPQGSETQYYTRSGQFRFDSDGYFVNPAGYVAMGWALDEDGNDEGTLAEIQLSTFTSPPEATEEVTAITNLNANDTSRSTSLFGAWDATAADTIGDNAYGYQTAVRVYDSLGNSHDITVFYDKMDPANSEYYDGVIDAHNTWEYIVTCDPDADQRAGFIGQVQQGVLMRGTLTYNSSTGALSSLTAFTCDPNTPDPSDDANWEAATDWSTNGYPEFTANFVSGVDQVMSVQFGARSTGAAWTGGVANIGDIDPADPLAGNIPTSSWEPQALTSTQYASSSTTIYQTQDGYGTGFLENVSVDTDGVMVGHYSNGQILYLYRVGLAKFNNNQALSKMGGNLWASTRASGDAITGHPGENGLGRISPNSLEQSNVDIASEFVKMISTQRGFQANSRIITTVDTMLQELINLVR